MKSQADLTQGEWDMVWYWLGCYECPQTEQCSDDKLCKTCKIINSIIEKTRGVK